jgi:hypothetical protein
VVHEEIRKEIKNLLEFNEDENTPLRTYSKGSPKRKVYSHECLY